VRHQGCLWGWHRHQEGRDSAPGAVFEETGRPLAVLTGDFLEGSIGGMTDGRKKKKDSIGLDWNSRAEVLRSGKLLPLDQIGDKLRNFRAGEI